MWSVIFVLGILHFVQVTVQHASFHVHRNVQNVAVVTCSRDREIYCISGNFVIRNT